MVYHRRYCHRRAPSLATVSRNKGSDEIDGRGSPQDRHHHSSIRLNQRNAANAIRQIRRVLNCSPSQSAIVRSTHFDEVLLRGIIPFHITMSVKRTGGSVVAHDPIL